jgi:hypothetical protein
MRRGANILALLWTLGAAAFFLLVPVYGRTSSARTISPDGTSTHVVSTGQVGLLAVSGWSALIPLTIPVLLCLVPLLLQSPKAQRRALAAAAMGIGALVLLGAASIGLFYVPAVVALVVAFTHTPSNPTAAAHR